MYISLEATESLRMAGAGEREFPEEKSSARVGLEPSGTPELGLRF